MRTWIGAVAGIMGALLLSGLALAIAYTISIGITESAGNSYEMAPFMASMNNAWYANAHYMADDALDTRVLDGTADIPHMVTDNATWFVTSLARNSTKSLRFTTGNAPLTSFPIIPGAGGHVVVPYDSSLAPGDDFDYSFPCYINTDAVGSNVFLVPNTSDNSSAILISVTDYGQVTATVEAGSGGPLVLNPSFNGYTDTINEPDGEAWGPSRPRSGQRGALAASTSMQQTSCQLVRSIQTSGFTCTVRSWHSTCLATPAL